MANWQEKERAARQAIENYGFSVHDANVLFRANCPNIDLVVYGHTKAVYVQVKSSEIPASKDGVVIDGSPWTQAQLYEGAPIFNRHAEPGQFKATFILIVDQVKNGDVNYYIAPPRALEDLLRERAVAWAEHPKKDGSRRSLGFRKELPRETLAPWLNTWHLLD